MRKTSPKYLPGRQYCLDYQRCHLSHSQRANKVVVCVNTDDDPTPLRHLNISSVEEHVVKMKTNIHSWGTHNLYSESRAKRLVLILSPANQDTSSTTSSYHDQELWECMDIWADHLAFHCNIRQSSSDIFMVNFDDLENRMITQSADLSGAFERLCRQTIDQFDASDYLTPKRLQWRTASEAASVSIKFIAMNEYLTNYDWTGVYTKEEVVELLQVEDLKRDQ